MKLGMAMGTVMDRSGHWPRVRRSVIERVYFTYGKTSSLRCACKDENTKRIFFASTTSHLSFILKFTT